MLYAVAATANIVIVLIAVSGLFIYEVLVWTMVIPHGIVEMIQIQFCNIHSSVLGKCFIVSSVVLDVLMWQHRIAEMIRF
jgi:fumarate reductase subunit D